MLDDPKSDALMSNFAGQWLFMRNLATVRPDPVVFPEFDESLRAGFQAETELFFESILRENRSALELLTANYTFLNERLANHYGIPNIYGSQFRRVDADRSQPRRPAGPGQPADGNIVPQPDVCSTERQVGTGKSAGYSAAASAAQRAAARSDHRGSKQLTLREAMEMHRDNPVCASCHARMDPIGFALENYDGVGKWRAKDSGAKIDASGKLPDGMVFNGPAGLKKLLTTTRRDDFVSTVTEKLMTYALGRGVEYYDRPALRAIVRRIGARQLKLADLIKRS